MFSREIKVCGVTATVISMIGEGYHVMECPRDQELTGLEGGGGWNIEQTCIVRYCITIIIVCNYSTVLQSLESPLCDNF